MSRKFLTNIDLNNNELQNAVVQNLSSAPNSGNKEGRIYYDSVTHKLRYFGASGAWYDLAAGGTAASTVTLTGDVTGTASVDPATGVISLSTTADSKFVTLTDTQTLTNKTLTNPTLKGRLSLTDGNDNETAFIEHSYTGTTRITANDDLALRSVDGDIILYPGNDDGGPGKAYIHWGDDNWGAYPEREIATVGTEQTFSNKTYDSPVIVGTINAYDSELDVRKIEITNAGIITNNSNNLKFVANNGSLILDTQAGSGTLEIQANYINTTDAEMSLRKTEYWNGGTQYGVITNNGNTFKQIATTGDFAIESNNGDVNITADGSVNVNSTLNANNGVVTTSVYNNNEIVIESGGNDVTIVADGEINLNASTNITGNGYVSGNLQVDGNLNVNGTLNAINRTEINIQDNTIRLNTGFTGAPTVDAGIIVERGTDNDTAIIWNETNDAWQLTNDGSNYYAIARKYVSVIGDASNTSFDVVHNLGTRDVTVQVYQNSSEYDIVETDVKNKDGNTVTVSFTDAPSVNAYKVVIIG